MTPSPAQRPGAFLSGLFAGVTRSGKVRAGDGFFVGARSGSGSDLALRCFLPIPVIRCRLLPRTGPDGSFQHSGHHVDPNPSIPHFLSYPLGSVAGVDHLEAEALSLLRRLTGIPDAVFRDGQLEAITAVVVERA